MSATIKRGTARRPVQPKRRPPPKVSTIDRVIAMLPVSEATLRRIATWTIMGVVGAGALATASYFGVPGAVGSALGEAIGEAGFRVTNIQITGLNRMDHNVIYKIAANQPSMAMPLVSLEKIRQDLVAHSGWIEDAHVSRRLPDTLIVHVVEREPSAIWQKDGQLALIAANGTWLEPVDPQAMPDLPLVIGAHANEQEAAYRQLLDVAPALRGQVKAATWVGNRRWTLTFETGETLALPEGDVAAGKALVKFAELDGVKPLLGKGWLGFDMRDPTRLVARKPGTVTNRAITDPAAPLAGATGAATQPVRIEAKQSGPAGEG
ncbi:FtsQ-type POTRA domain-containing protein [Sphingomonas sp. TF3]|uniref:cell division protein FtsQ/DivIB n=1 Tax=Sphingomonas sp. TF3 TaxID=2495580 RepID=UPI000F896739|nr:cell division protein FtsQ/DivIB [Sphingomonas sp. TF3]RUN76770.1 FtsQ-type POTRA domain-containing protein [Sphingomonas sp. TF3]